MLCCVCCLGLLYLCINCRVHVYVCWTLPTLACSLWARIVPSFVRSEAFGEGGGGGVSLYVVKTRAPVGRGGGGCLYVVKTQAPVGRVGAVSGRSENLVACEKGWGWVSVYVVKTRAPMADPLLWWFEARTHRCLYLLSLSAVICGIPQRWKTHPVIRGFHRVLSDPAVRVQDSSTWEQLEDLQASHFL